MTNQKKLSENTIDPNPFIQFDKWYSNHLTYKTEIPESFSLATSSKKGRLSVRTVLLKSFDDRGFVFFTNYKSRKSQQLLETKMAALLFYWSGPGRQIRIEGSAEKITEEESLEYFAARPRESQLSAWASQQSSPIGSRLELEADFEKYKLAFLDKTIPKPPYWGGFRLVPDWFEFWQNGLYRLHDRISYTKRGNVWTIERLAP